MRIFKILFIFLYVVPFSIVFFDSNFTSYGLAYILISIIFTLFLTSFSHKRNGKGFKLTFSKKIITFLFFVFFILNSNVIYETLLSVFNGNFLEIGLEIALERYSGNSTININEKIANTILFCISLLLGFRNPKKDGYLNYILYFICILVIIRGLARAGALINIIFFLSSFLVSNSEIINSYSYKKLTKYIFILFFLSSLLFVIPQYGRVVSSDSPVEIISSKVRSYTLSIYDAFAIFIKKYPDIELSDEFKTIGILNKFSNTEKIQGTYDSVYLESGKTNIYTIFRGLIEDYSLTLFPLLLFILYYSALKIFYVKSLKYFVLSFWTIPFFLFPFFSIFYFNSVLIGYLMFALIVLNFSKIKL